MSSTKTSSKSSENYYEILGLDKNATDEEIKQSYRKLALKYHPDKNPSAESTEQFQRIKKAYEILIDPRTRDAYDRFGTQAAEAVHQYNEYPTRMERSSCSQKFCLALICCLTGCGCCCACFCCFFGFFCCCDCCCDHCCHHCCHPERSSTRIHHQQPTDDPEEIFSSRLSSSTKF